MSPRDAATNPREPDATLAAASTPVRRPSPIGLLRLIHPFPTLLNAIVVVAMAYVAADGDPPLGRVLLLASTMLAIQATIGVTNDYRDRDLDAQAKPWKPIPSGRVHPGFSVSLARMLFFLALFLVLRGPADAVPWALLGLGAGMAYNFGLKRTPYSALTYAIALPLVPVWVWTALDRDTPALYAVLPVGALLGFGLQLVNALPDARSDSLGGVRGTLQWLGVERGRRVAWASIGAAILLALALAPVADLSPLPLLPCAGLSALLLAVAALAHRIKPGERTLAIGWALLAPAAGVLAVGWLTSMP